MVIPEHIREKIEQRLKLDQEIKSYIEQNTKTEGIDISSMEITNIPLGSDNGDGVYCTQEKIGGTFGHYYFPMDNGSYLCVFFDTDD